jgi:hypothetical protein
VRRVPQLLAVLSGALVAALALGAGGAPSAEAATLAQVGDFTRPVYVMAPPRDTRNVFVVERGGTVRLLVDGVRRARPFLDISGLVAASTSRESERGLLSIAFAPDYLLSGRFYVFYTSRRPPAARTGDIAIDEFRRSATDPEVADPATRRPILAVDHDDYENHNGGQLAFGPDGYLYAGTGDGGGSNDLEDDAADPRSLLGKILRIDPRRAGGRRRAIPPGNPFGNEVWAYGLRNPWRFSFDRATGDLVIGDVGQGVAEEIDWAPAAHGRGRGADFGWHCRQGDVATPRNPNDRRSPPLCRRPPRSAQAPAIALDHGPPDRFCAVVGGFVVRDPGLPSLAGRYLFGDFCRPDLFTAVLGAPGRPTPTGLSVRALKSFGEDACGRIYTASLGGEVRRLQENGAPSSACGPDKRRAASRASLPRHRSSANPSASPP